MKRSSGSIWQGMRPNVKLQSQPNKSSQIVMAGPVDLVQGGRAFIGRMAVHTMREDASESFWGLVSAPISALNSLKKLGFRPSHRCFPYCSLARMVTGAVKHFTMTLPFSASRTMSRHGSSYLLDRGRWRLPLSPQPFEAIGMSAWIVIGSSCS